MEKGRIEFEYISGSGGKFRTEHSEMEMFKYLSR